MYNPVKVIFIDFAGTLCTNYYQSDSQIEEKVKILADICHTYDAKIVISSGSKQVINEETLEIDHEASVLYLFYLFAKYEIEVIGRTPSVKKYSSDGVCFKEMWKEDEIRLYLMRHQEIVSYCVIDDDDLSDIHQKSDLDKVRSHLVKTSYYNKEEPEKEGLQPFHKELVGKVLSKDNDVLHSVFRYRRYKQGQFKPKCLLLNKQ